MKICILGLEDYAQLSKQRAVEYVGGESVQHVLLARAWRDLGHQVSIIVHDEGQGRIRDFDGIRAVAVYTRTEGVPVLRFAHPRLTRMIAAMREIDADVYYQSPGGAATGITTWFCRRYGKRSVIRIASDLACMPGQQLIRYWRDRKIYEYGLRHAELIVAQTEQQRLLLRQNYGVQSEVLNMAVEVPAPQTDAADIDVLWVANFRPVKRPELVFEIARRLPLINFTLVGGSLPGAEDYFASMMKIGRELPNVRCLGAVPYADVGELFGRSRLFLNTSSMEGFPNTFLQAWIRGVPVVSFFDPDQLIQRKQLGRAVETLDEMVAALSELLRDEAARRRMGERARSFAMDEFSAPHIAQRYLELLDRTSQPDVLRYGTNG